MIPAFYIAIINYNQELYEIDKISFETDVEDKLLESSFWQYQTHRVSNIDEVFIILFNT